MRIYISISSIHLPCRYSDGFQNRAQGYLISAILLRTSKTVPRLRKVTVFHSRDSSGIFAAFNGGHDYAFAIVRRDESISIRTPRYRSGFFCRYDIWIVVVIDVVNSASTIDPPVISCFETLLHGVFPWTDHVETKLSCVFVSA
ncbi:hypothetical protein KCP69_12795 [Salmonella enterica subsp. enterica]|nr:hypothetical protein KCP69_12795 [Salmonella enterica subsp. enterica]